MTEQEAKRLEVPTEWNGKANVCAHCGRVPETFYVATGHDHTDYDIPWCVCRSVAPSIEQLQSEVTELEAENEQLSLYKNLADEYGLSVFADLAELQKQRDDKVQCCPRCYSVFPTQSEGGAK